MAETGGGSFWTHGDKRKQLALAKVTGKNASTSSNRPSVKNGQEGLPWQSSGEDSLLPLQGAMGLVPVRESKLLHATQPKKKRERERKFLELNKYTNTMFT